jgi:hypothetical protein
MELNMFSSQQPSRRHSLQRFLRIAFSAALLLVPSLAPAQPAPEQEKEDASPKLYERFIEDRETGKIVLQLPVRRFERQGTPGPVVFTHSMVHIADRPFYEKHQELLRPVDVVLFELVLPSGAGRPEYSLQDPESAEWKLRTTLARLQTVATLAKVFEIRRGKLPKNFQELRESDVGFPTFGDRLATDGWGNDWHFSLVQPKESDPPVASDSSSKPTPFLQIASWGSDNARGGDGDAADLVLSNQQSLSPMNAPTDMPRMAHALGLAFQGDVERNDQPNWRSSDLSSDQVSERMAASGLPNEERKTADAWMPLRLLETMSTMSQGMPGLKNAGKLYFLESLAESPIQKLDSSNDVFAKVIIEDRNRVTLDDLSAIIAREPNIKSVAIVYGAAHMPDFDAHLLEMGYVETRTDWIDAITVYLPENPDEREQLEMSRKTLRGMGLLGGADAPGEGKKRRWRKSNTSEEALSQNYRKEIMRDWVGKLAAMLDADRETQREQAEKTLMNLGSAALPYLPAIADDDSDEYRMRLNRVRSALLATDKELLNKPGRVNLTGTMSGMDALNAIADQTGNRLSLKEVPGLDASITVELDDALYWEALDEILDQLDLAIPPNDGDDLRLIPRQETFPQRLVMANYSGSFRIEPIAMTKTQRLYEPEANSTSIELLLSWEPRLNPVFVRYELDGLELKCNNGEILRPKPNQGTDFTPSGSQLVSLLEFDRPTRSAKEIVEWKGRFLCAIPGKPVAIRFTELGTARNKVQSMGDLEVTLERSRKNRDVYEILVGIALRGDQSIDSMQGWTSLIEAYIEDSEGNRIEHAGWSTTRVTDDDVGVSFLFEVEDDLADYEFVFIAPQSITQQTVEYSLGGIVLP